MYICYVNFPMRRHLTTLPLHHSLEAQLASIGRE